MPDTANHNLDSTRHGLDTARQAVGHAVHHAGADIRAHCPAWLRPTAGENGWPPQMAHPDWEPGFVDYLHLSFTNATAFSPTDVLPLSRWTKLTMLASPWSRWSRSRW